MESPKNICSECLMPSTYPGIRFNKSGVCNHCYEFSPQTLKGEKQFLDTIRAKKSDKYDCVIGISGGKDSCYVAYLAKAKYNLRPLAVCYDFPFLVDLARENIKKVCNSLNIDLIFIKTKKNIEYDLVRNHLISLSATGTTWGQCMFCHYGIDAVLYNVAMKKNIPFILSGITGNELWNPGSRMKFLKSRIQKLNLKDLFQFINYQSKSYWRLINQRREFKIPGNNCLKVYKHPDPPINGPAIIRVFDFIKWDQTVIEKTLKEKTGWEKPARATSWRYDCILEPLLDYTYKKEFGISTVGLYLSGLIRDGLISREEAITTQKLCEDNRQLRQSVKEVFEFLKIPEQLQNIFFSAD